MADRTQTPSGAGYALENREILEQVLPDSLAELHTRHIRGFFGELRNRLLDDIEAKETPLAVILTPGPFNETYFEHAYLARQLGLPLVEGTDLTVRNDTVYLKTVAGLRRVHAILRRLDDDYCDPVELRSDSALGVAGLLGRVRAGRVEVANALGTGVLESAACWAFYRRSRRDCSVRSWSCPSLATWWCGEALALDYVLAHLDELVIKPAWPNQRFEPVFGRTLTGDARRQLIDRLQTRPHAYVAQEHMALSQAPVWRPYGALGFAAKSHLHPHVCRCESEGTQDHAGWTGTDRRERCRGRRRLHAAGRRKQGYLGTHRVRGRGSRGDSTADLTDGHPL